MSVLDKLDAATTARAQVKLVLDAKLTDTFGQLQDQWMTGLTERVGDDAKFTEVERKKLTAQMEAVSVQMAASEVTFVFERLDWIRRLTLQAEHPPRVEMVDGAEVTNPEDKRLGFNLHTYTPALIKETCVEIRDATSVATAEEITEARWDALFSTLNYAAVDRLFGVALSVNDLDTAVPSLALVSQTSRAIGESLKPPAPGVSARNGSKAGSRPPKRSTATTRKAGSKR